MNCVRVCSHCSSYLCIYSPFICKCTFNKVTLGPSKAMSLAKLPLNFTGLAVSYFERLAVSILFGKLVNVSKFDLFVFINEL